ncbi:Capsule biosynthesis protein capA [hydrothermal vent metagenome]|uniref:Capsule biosynthesis protein capA n=1 Tax=hydrothermal vent metagenome TaxID=652676 RepID=A0A3B1B254_9ZZZZ
MIISKHLSNIFDGCFYFCLLSLVSCSSILIDPNEKKTPKKQNRVLDIGYSELKHESINFQNDRQKSLTNSTFKIAAVGDIMLGTNYPYNHLPDKDIVDLLEDVKPILTQADISFGNLEGVLLDKGEPAKQCADLKRCYVFRSPVSYAKQLKDAGFTMLSLANNHARDFGEEGRLSTMTALDEQGILHSGVVNNFATLTLKDSSFAMVAFAPFVGANDMLDLPLAGEVVKNLSTQYDVVMVSMHGGAEGIDMTRLPFATEYFYNEDRGDVVQFARTMVDNGADLVLGHGPHVPRAMELYKDRLIAYSLGNFATYYGISVKGQRGLAPLLELEVSNQGHFISGKIHSFRQNRPNGPQPDDNNCSAKLIQQVSKQDFPESMLHISNDGDIYKLSQSR